MSSPPRRARARILCWPATRMAARSMSRFAPIHLNVARFYTPYVRGLYRSGAAAYVTRGIGTIGIPARIGAPPEITLIRLERPEAASLRYIILSDLHGNLGSAEAPCCNPRRRLRSVSLLRRSGRLWRRPQCVTDWVRAKCAFVVRGNHDRACAGLEDLEWFNPMARSRRNGPIGLTRGECATTSRGLPKGPIAVMVSR